MQIELKNITKTYNAGKKTSVQVLKGINLTIEKGQMVAIKGPSGSGKSTLLHILGCLDKSDGGTYTLDGEDITKKTLSQLSEIRNSKIGFVMQHFALVDTDTVLENIGIPLMFGKQKLSRIDGLAYEQMSKLGILPLAKSRATNLSGGEKQRVAIARALINDPDIILADEPTGALDQQNTEAVMKIFRNLNEQGKTVIIVTHEEYVAENCKRVIHICDGMIKE